MKLGFIFLDMDETLGFFRNYDGSMNSEGFASGIYLRSGIREVLSKLKEDYLLFITTAATVTYTKAVLSHTGLERYFHGIYSRTDFVVLENEGDAGKEASPGGYEKRYSLIMKHYDIKEDQAEFGLIVGDNDYDTSCDVPELKTLIVDSLFINAEIIYSIIKDIFAKKTVNEFKAKEKGLRIFKKVQNHPLVELESESYEIECIDDFKPSELEEVPVVLTETEKEEMKVTVEERNESLSGIQALEEVESVEDLGSKLEDLENDLSRDENLITKIDKEDKLESNSRNEKQEKIVRKKRFLFF